MGDHPGQLGKFRCRCKFLDEIDLCPVDMAIGIMFEQVAEGENIEFLFQQVGLLRTNAFEVLDGAG
jgi:hypothetical protein